MIMRKKLFRALEGIVGRGNVLRDRAALSVYDYDASLFRGHPDAVVFVTSTEQVSQLVKLASRTGVPYVARGSGTNLSGGSILHHGGIIINLCRMDRILELNFRDRTALVEPGFTT